MGSSESSEDICLGWKEIDPIQMELNSGETSHLTNGEAYKGLFQEKKNSWGSRELLIKFLHLIQQWYINNWYEGLDCKQVEC